MNLFQEHLAFPYTRNDIARMEVSESVRDALFQVHDQYATLVQRCTSLATAAAVSDALRIKLRKAHAELERRRRRDVEMAHHLPAIAARLQVIAADAKQATEPDPAPNANWENDPEIDWTGIER